MVGFATRIAKDMTEHKQHEDHLRRLSVRLMSAQEEERRRIARELHDHVNQSLALLSVELGQLGRVSPSTSAAETLIQAMQQRVRALSSDVHDLSHRLHPAKLKHLGLVPALRALCRDMEEHGLHVCWSVPALFSSPSMTTRTISAKPWLLVRWPTSSRTGWYPTCLRPFMTSLPDADSCRHRRN